MRPSRGRGVALAISALLLVAIPAASSAHSELEHSTPADGATVPSPFDGPIVLEFSATLARGSKADLLDPDGATVAAATVDGPDATMIFTLDAGLAAGTYEIKWTSVAVDTDVARERSNSRSRRRSRRQRRHRPPSPQRHRLPSPRRHRQIRDGGDRDDRARELGAVGVAQRFAVRR